MVVKYGWKESIAEIKFNLGLPIFIVQYNNKTVIKNVVTDKRNAVQS